MRELKTVKEKIRDREPVFGTMISGDGLPNLARIFKAARFCLHDCGLRARIFRLFPAGGHGFRWQTARGSARWCAFPTIDRGVITKVLDMGADGLLVPMVNTADEARQIVAYAKYPPWDTGGASTQRAPPITTRRSWRSILRSPTPEP